ncbi:MAG: hypothetical protein QF862_01745 [Prochlorococcaceae cyanobacterium ETNP7_MAG_30]|nr:hypothetical protein [Prochlorococcaceae cyanobacterium ETNP7_MAG_30]
MAKLASIHSFADLDGISLMVSWQQSALEEHINDSLQDYRLALDCCDG